jgi:acetyl esterase/lipase
MYNVPLQMKQALAAHTNAFGADREAWMPVSPWHHVEADKGIPSFLLLVSSGRPTMHEQVLPLQARFREAGIEAVVHEGEGRAHSPLDTYLGVDGDETTRVLVEFLARHFDR